MGTGKHRANPTWVSISAVLGVCLLITVAVSCRSPHQSTCRSEPNLDAGWPQGNPAGWPKGSAAFTQVAYQQVRGALPTIPGADYVNDDELCASCHGAYTKLFAENVHRGDTCEGCHGPASRHLETRGKEPGLIFGFKTGDPVARAEACLRCHEENNCAEGTLWRRSRHAHCGVTCVDCHRGHYDVPSGTPATTEPATASIERLPSPVSPTALLVAGEEKAADGKGYKPPAKNLASLRGSSRHLGAVAPGICYKCHCDKRELQEIAGPHQICGPNGFNCTTCHDPHGQIKESTRKDLCLSCHKTGAPTMAWHSSTHELNGVYCTDCHNPHPNSKVQPFVGISHTNVSRPKRLPMSVQEPEACFKCHPKILGLTSLPSHHPIKEGKMVCSDCHDPHGQQNGNLKAVGVGTVNQLCYKCHAEKQGPFAYPHPVVDENCAICHEPHGTVANNLLRQPPNFLCLRCHVGHRQTLHGHQSPVHSNTPANTATYNFYANNDVPSVRADIDRNPAMRTSFYSDCTQCHSQIHGSDLPTGHTAGVLMR